MRGITVWMRVVSGEVGEGDCNVWMRVVSGEVGEGDCSVDESSEWRSG